MTSNQKLIAKIKTSFIVISSSYVKCIIIILITEMLATLKQWKTNNSLQLQINLEFTKIIKLIAIGFAINHEENR